MTGQRREADLGGTILKGLAGCGALCSKAQPGVPILLPGPSSLLQQPVHLCSLQPQALLLLTLQLFHEVVVVPAELNPVAAADVQQPAGVAAGAGQGPREQAGVHLIVSRLRAESLSAAVQAGWVEVEAPGLPGRRRGRAARPLRRGVGTLVAPQARE